MGRYLLWIPLAIIYNVIICWIVVKYNQTNFLKTYCYIMIASLIPSWAIAGYFSKNLILDGLLYDMILVISGPIILTFLGQATHFTVVNWIGVVITIFGLFLVRVNK